MHKHLPVCLHSPANAELRGFGSVLRLRGGSEALHSRDFDPIDKRLAELEMLHKQGHLSESEMLKERERLLLASAERGLDLQKELEEGLDEEAMSASNATVARRANNNLARMLAERLQDLEAGDGSASDGLVRLDGRIGFSQSEIATWQRRCMYVVCTWGVRCV